MSRKRGFIRVATALLLSAIFALVFFTFNTPLGPSIGNDNSMYLTMGTALTHGYAPYTQIFDHKGPLLFLIQMLPQLFFGGYQTFTVFVMEWLFLFGCLFTIDALCDRVGLRCTWVLQLVYLALYAPCVGGGNLSEEYVSLFTLLGLTLILHTFDAGEKPVRPLFPALLLGALATLSFLTRANNALPLLGATFGVTLCLACTGDWKTLVICACGFLIGCSLALAPFILWLSSQGALSDALYGSITHNLMYVQTEGMSRIQILFHSEYGRWAMLMAVLSTVGALCCYLRTRRAILPASLVFGAAFAGLAAFLSHKYYQHYLTLGAPLAVLGMAQILRLARDRSSSTHFAICKTCVALLCCAALFFFGHSANASRISERKNLDQFADDARTLYAQVPEEDRGSFMAYRVESKWYVFTEALPCMRFYFLQETLGQADPRVMDEIVETFEQNPPRWLVIYYNRPFSPPYDERVQAIIDSRYAFVDARGEYQLLRLTDQD